MSSPRPVYFMSDAHLTTRPVPEERARSKRVTDFLAHVRDTGSGLYIIGDLFDFWFAYKHALPGGHFQLYRRFYELGEAGVPMTFLAGNHDFWCVDFLAEEFGMATHPDPISAEIQGRKIWMAHGDGLVKKDWGYRAMRKVLRSPFCIAAYRIIHPDIGIPLAHDSSTHSRGVTSERRHRLLRLLGRGRPPPLRRGVRCGSYGPHSRAHPPGARGEGLLLPRRLADASSPS